MILRLFDVKKPIFVEWIEGLNESVRVLLVIQVWGIKYIDNIYEWRNKIPQQIYSYFYTLFE